MLLSLKSTLTGTLNRLDLALSVRLGEYKAVKKKKKNSQLLSSSCRQK